MAIRRHTHTHTRVRRQTHASSVCGVCKLAGCLSLCHGSEGKQGGAVMGGWGVGGGSAEELRAIIRVPKKRLMYADDAGSGGRGGGGRYNHREHSLKAQKKIHNGLYGNGEPSNAATHARANKIYARLRPAYCSTSVPDSEGTGRTRQSDTHYPPLRRHHHHHYDSHPHILMGLLRG